jgi:hypothetical protein
VEIGQSSRGRTLREREDAEGAHLQARLHEPRAGMHGSMGVCEQEASMLAALHSPELHFERLWDGGRARLLGEPRRRLLALPVYGGLAA